MRLHTHTHKTNTVCSLCLSYKLHSSSALSAALVRTTSLLLSIALVNRPEMSVEAVTNVHIEHIEPRAFLVSWLCICIICIYTNIYIYIVLYQQPSGNKIYKEACKRGRVCRGSVPMFSLALGKIDYPVYAHYLLTCDCQVISQ